MSQTSAERKRVYEDANKRPAPFKVTVRLTAADLAKLDQIRGTLTRAEALRRAALGARTKDEQA